MAHTVMDDQKGRAAGWYQAGNLGGNGIGGGAGVWLAAHYSKEVAAWSISLAMLACAFALYFVSDVRPVVTETLRERMRYTMEGSRLRGERHDSAFDHYPGLLTHRRRRHE